MEAALFVFTFILFAYNVTYTARKSHRTVYTARNTDILSLNICQAFSRFILAGNACSLTDSHAKNVKRVFCILTMTSAGLSARSHVLRAAFAFGEFLDGGAMLFTRK